jgi:hypothetical protein
MFLHLIDVIGWNMLTFLLTFSSKYITACGKFVNISKIVLTWHFSMLTYTSRNILDYMITGNTKTVTSVDRQNTLVGRFDIHNFSIIFYIPSVSI